MESRPLSYFPKCFASIKNHPPNILVLASNPLPLLPPFSYILTDVLDLGDEEQVGLLHRLLGRSPHLIEYYLHHTVFPKALAHAGVRPGPPSDRSGSPTHVGRA